MADEKKDMKAPEAAKPDTKRYFKCAQSCTVMLPADHDEKTGKFTKCHMVTFKKGTIYAADKPHEVKLCLERGFKETKKPEPKKAEEIE